MTQHGVSRRRFLRRAAASVLAAPCLVSRSALGGDGRAPASDRIGLGFIGLGGEGNAIMGGFLGAVTQPLAVCDPWENRREAARRRLGGNPAMFSDFRELLGVPGIDAVVIATPEYWHALIAIAAATAGKDVFCEKALAVTVAEGRAMCDAITRYGRVFQHGTQQRSDYRFRTACELVRNGRIGKLHTIRASVPASSASGFRKPLPVPKELDYEMWLGPSPWIPYCGQAGIGHPGWCFRSDYTPGFILTWGVHHLDIAQWGNNTELSGPTEFDGHGVFPRDGYDDAVMTWHVEATYPGGVRLIFTSENEHPNGVRFEGDAGWIFVTRGSWQADPPALLASPIGQNEIHLYRSDHHVANFLECVRTRRPTVAPIEIAHRATTIGLVSAITLRLGRKLRWDPQHERFVNEDEANRLLSRSMREPWTL